MAGRHLDLFLCYSMISTLVSSDIRNNDYGWLLFAFATKTLLSYPSTVICEDGNLYGIV
jgi:hypothetical protein